MSNMPMSTQNRLLIRRRFCVHIIQLMRKYKSVILFSIFPNTGIFCLLSFYINLILLVSFGAEMFRNYHTSNRGHLL